MRKLRQECMKKHQAKLQRDLNFHKVYIATENTEGPILNTRRKNRRSKKRQKRVKKTQRQNIKDVAQLNPENVSEELKERTFLNLTNYQLTEDQKYLMFLSKPFSPTPTSIDRPQLEIDWNNFCFRLRHKFNFAIKSKEVNLDDNTPPQEPNPFERSLIKSENTYPIFESCPALELFLDKCGTELLKSTESGQQSSSNLSTQHQKALKDLKNLEKDHGIIIRPYDKGTGFVLRHKADYKAEMEKELGGDVFVKIENKEAAIENCVKRVKGWIKKWREEEPLLTGKVCNWLTPTIKSKPGNNYLNTKRHKPEKNYPGRLISTGRGTYIENLSKLTAFELNKCLPNLKHVIKDGNEFLRMIDELNENDFVGKNPDIIHVSWDVEAMFPSIPKDMGLAECKAQLGTREDGLSTDCVMEALKITLENNLTEFDGELYRQIKGAGIGPNNSSQYCDIAMNKIDGMVMGSTAPYLHNLWIRFRDDTYEPWTHGEAALNEFTTWINTISPHIKFTVKYSREGIEFLDNFIYIREGKFHTKVHSKPSDTFCYLTPNSCHPFHQVRNIPQNTSNRIRKICSEECEYEKQKHEYSSHLVARGYDSNFVSAAFAAAEQKGRGELYKNKGVNNTEGEPQ